MEAKKEWQVFISCKVTDDSGKDTRDCKLAETVYKKLKAKSVKVFMSKHSLIETGNSNYQEEIDRALEEARILIIVTTRPDHLESGWVKHEWETFQNEIKSGRKNGGSILVFADNLPVSSLPLSLRKETFVPKSPGAIDKLLEFVENTMEICSEAAQREPALKSRKKKKPLLLLGSIGILLILGILTLYFYNTDQLYQKLLAHCWELKERNSFLNAEIANTKEKLNTEAIAILRHLEMNLGSAETIRVNLKKAGTLMNKPIEIYGNYSEMDSIEKKIEDLRKTIIELKTTRASLSRDIGKIDGSLTTAQLKIIHTVYDVEFFKHNYSKLKVLHSNLRDQEILLVVISSELKNLLERIEELTYGSILTSEDSESVFGYARHL